MALKTKIQSDDRPAARVDTNSDDGDDEHDDHNAYVRPLPQQDCTAVTIIRASRLIVTFTQPSISTGSGRQQASRRNYRCEITAEHICYREALAGRLPWSWQSQSWKIRYDKINNAAVTLKIMFRKPPLMMYVQWTENLYVLCVRFNNRRLILWKYW